MAASTQNRLIADRVGYVVNPPHGEVSSDKILIELEDEEVPLFSILVAHRRTDPGTTHYYILRIHEKTYSSPLATPQQAKTRRALFGEEMSPEKAMSSLFSYSGALAEVVDVAVEEDGRIVPIGPRFVPPPGTPVHRPGPGVTSILLGSREVPIAIGTLMDVDGAPATIDLQALTRHMLIVGSTGTGKSWLRGVLLERLHQLGIPQILFDPLRDYTEAVRQLGGAVLRYGRDFLPALYELPKALFRAMLEDVLTPLQASIAAKGFEMYRSSAEPRNPEELLNYISRAADQMRARDETRENTLARVESLLEDLGYLGRGRPPMINSRGLADLIRNRQIVDIDLVGIGDTALQVTVATVLTQLRELREADAVDPLVVSFDETHRIAPRSYGGRNPPPSLYVVRETARFGRHYGIGLIVITQYPDSVDEELVRLPATRVIFALDPGQTGGITGLLKDLPSAIRDVLPKLERGTAFLTGTHDSVRHTVYVRIAGNRSTMHGGATPKFRVRPAGPGPGGSRSPLEKTVRR